MQYDLKLNLVLFNIYVHFYIKKKYLIFYDKGCSS